MNDRIIAAAFPLGVSSSSVESKGFGGNNVSLETGTSAECVRRGGSSSPAGGVRRGSRLVDDAAVAAGETGELLRPPRGAPPMTSTPSSASPPTNGRCFPSAPRVARGLLAAENPSCTSTPTLLSRYPLGAGAPSRAFLGLKLPETRPAGAAGVLLLAEPGLLEGLNADGPRALGGLLRMTSARACAPAGRSSTSGTLPRRRGVCRAAFPGKLPPPSAVSTRRCTWL